MNLVKEEDGFLESRLFRDHARVIENADLVAHSAHSNAQHILQIGGPIGSTLPLVVPKVFPVK